MKPGQMQRCAPVESSLRAARDRGRKLLVPYVTGGLSDEWSTMLLAMAEAGADAIEVGLPFSDPMMDGPTIQEASLRALERGTTPASVLARASVRRALGPAPGDDVLQPGAAGGHQAVCQRAGRRRRQGGDRARPAPRGVGGNGRSTPPPRASKPSCWPPR